MICVFLIPGQMKEDSTNAPEGAKWRSLDLVGVGILTGNVDTLIGQEMVQVVNVCICSCSHPLHLRHNIWVKYWMGLCWCHRTPHPVDIYGCGFLLLRNEDPFLRSRCVRNNRSSDN